MLIQYKNFISKKIYYLEVHIQKIGQLYYHAWKEFGNGKLLNSVSDTFVNIVFKRLLSNHIRKGREENSVDPKNFKDFWLPKSIVAQAYGNAKNMYLSQFSNPKDRMNIPV